MRDTQILEYIGGRLKTERERLGFSQEELGALLGCSQTQYSRFERGKRELGTIQLYNLATELQMLITSFMPAGKPENWATSETGLVEAWRANDLARVLVLISERFSPHTKVP